MLLTSKVISENLVTTINGKSVEKLNMNNFFDESVNLMDLVQSDIFNHVQKYLKIKDYFNLRCVNPFLKNYIDSELRKLKQLLIPNCHPSITNALPVLIELCRNLSDINLNRNGWVDDKILMPLLRNNHATLTTLNLNGCNNIKEAACIQPVIISCKKLKKLSLQKCCWLTVGSIEALSFHHDNLKDLDLAGCNTINDRCLTVLTSKFRKIEILNLANIGWINDNTLKTISLNLKELKMLNLFNCSKISDEGIRALSKNCSKLESISVRGCSNVTERSLTFLRTRNIHIDRPLYAKTYFSSRRLSQKLET